MKSVCIAGAGPAGLVATKVLLQTGGFAVCTYEKKARIGGIWALDQTTQDGLISPFTPTNLSRFLVAFSDLDWTSVDLSTTVVNGDVSGGSHSAKPPMFPLAWQVNRYLEAYRQRYIPKGIITCGREITRAERVGSTWRITSRNSEGEEAVQEFDYFVMSNGFYPQPRLLNQNIRNLISESGVKIIHSSAFRNLSDLSPKDRLVSNKKILVIGGGNSSGETAAAVAMQLSNSQWSPDQSQASVYKDCQIIHVTPQPLYPLPPFQEVEEGSLSYVPLDFKFYNLAKRPAELASYAGLQPPEVRDVVHKMMQAVVGGDQSDVSEALVSVKGQDRHPAQASLTETYSEFVRSGLIDVTLGRVCEVATTLDGYAVATVQIDREEVRLENIAAVIYATGYTPCPAVDILDDETKRALDYDPTAMRLPLILDQWQTSTRSIPNLSFVGFYQGPYWGIIEMQARLTSQRWLQDKVASTNPYETQQALLDLRQAMHEGQNDVPQYGFSDYQGWMLDLATQLDLTRNDAGFGPREGSTVPARYLTDQDDRCESDATMADLHQTWTACVDEGRFVPRAVFRALQGDWRISRRIDSALATFPSGTFEGIAHFHPRSPTRDKSEQVFDFEYLYLESGTFTTSTGYSMPASRRYVYRYREAGDHLSVWFVKPDNDLEVDYLFHTLTFTSPRESREAGACIAKADHLCVRDMYWTEYRLPLRGVSLREFQATHTVKGPGKDYVATARYERFQK